MRMPIVLVLLIVCLALPDVAAAIVKACPQQPDIVVEAVDPAAPSLVCRTADRAIAYLSGFDLRLQRPIHILVVDNPLSSGGFDIYGRFDSRTDTIELMSDRAIAALATPTMYDEPFDAVHYRGAIAHEVVHAVMQHNLETKLISPAPQEYLAHAVQLALMPAVRRAHIVAAMDVGPWEAGDAISDIYMAMQPGRFAVKSYLHLSGLEHPEAFVHILLNANWFYINVPELRVVEYE